MTYSKSDGSSHGTLISVLQKHVAQQGDKIVYTFLDAAQDTKATLTYRQLRDEAQELALHLLTRVKKGDRALLLFENGAELIVAFFACLMSGIVAVPAYPPRKNRNMERLKNVVIDADASLILTSAKIAVISESQLQADEVLKHIAVLVTDNLPAASQAPKLPEILPTDLAFLQYSSGSTGAPKGVMISHDNIVQNQLRITAAFEHDQNSKVVSWLPYFHDMGLIGGILQPLFVGFPVYLMSPTWFLQKPIRWLKAISDFGGTTSGGPNFAWKLCVDKITDEELEGIDLSNWRVAFNGSEPINAQTLNEFTKRFAPYGFKSNAHLPCYGMAEATLMITTVNCKDEPTVFEAEKIKLSENIATPAKSNEESYSLVSSGHTWFDDQLIIVDPEMREQKAEGQVGEIWLRSPCVGQGYWKKDELNEEIFNAKIASTGEGPYLRTGDLGFVQGRDVFITGRQKDLIIIRGRNYYPQDIEYTVFNSVPAFSEHCAAAFTVPTKDGEGIVVVQEVKRTELKNINASEAIHACSQSVAEEMELPLHDIVLVKPATVAKTSSGKIQRAVNRQMYLDGQFERVASMLELTEKSAIANNENSQQLSESIPAINVDADKLIQWICDNIAEALDKSASQIDIDSNFFSLGLNSAVSVSFMAELSERINRELSPILIYDYPTIRKLVDYILCSSENQQQQSKSIVVDRDIAIIGMSCRLPGSDEPEEFWKNLLDGLCHVSAYPQSRAYGADVDSAVYSGGFLDDIEHFDNEFFSITGKEAPLIDPQHRLILELSEEVMRHAGYHPSELKGRDIGVFVGIGQNDYMLMGLASEEHHNPYSGAGTAMCMAANRVSYFYDFTGPSMAIDTACSAALVAVHEAVKSIRTGECESALVGAVKLIMFSQAHTILRNAQMLSPDGHCFSFDDKANGYVRGEGAGMVMLKPLNKARADGDNVLAIIKGTASNQDGKSNGISAPNGLAQQRVIHKALKDGNILPEQVDFVEAHGTGTALGDPIEVGALSNIYGIGREKTNSLLIGSVKANVGHLEHAAGMVGLLKAVQCLRHEQVPSQINFNTPNRHIPWNNIAIKVPVEQTKLNSTASRPLHVGVSSFGFGGSNSHIVLKQGDKIQVPERTESVETSPHLLALSARQAAAIKPMLANYAEHLNKWQHLPFEQLCWRLNQGQSNDTYRVALVANSVSKMISKLNSHKVENKGQEEASLAFMFTGQGSQYHAMAIELLDSQPVFKKAMERCDQLFSGYLAHSLMDVIYTDSLDGELLNQTAYTQPAIFAIEYALSQLWSSWGVAPALVMGHSIGEFAAAVVAGVMSLDDAVKLVAERGRLIQSLPVGSSMLAVRAVRADVAELLTEEVNSVNFAAINGPEALVLSGLTEHLKIVKAQLDQQGIASTLLNVSHAFHSKLMQPILEEFRCLVASVTLQKPKIPFVSCVTGELETAQFTRADYWVNHIEQPVLFEAALQTALGQGANTLLEIGPSAVLAKIARSQTKDSEAQCHWSLDKGLSASEHILHALAWVYMQGTHVRWDKVNPCVEAPRLPLPNYPFQRKRFWITLDPNLSGNSESAGRVATITAGTAADHLYRVEWRDLQNSIAQRESKKPRNWLMVTDKHNAENMELAGQLKAAIEKEGMACATIELADAYRIHSTKHYQVNGLEAADFKKALTALTLNWGQPQALIDCSSVGANIDEDTCIDAMYDRLVPGCYSSLTLIQGLMQAHLDGDLESLPRYFMVTQQAQLFAPDQPAMGIVHSTSWGLSKVVAQEYPELRCKNIDLQANEAKTLQAQRIIHEVCSDDMETQVAYLNGERKVARLTKVVKSELASRKPRFNANRQYLITGGLGALALKTARWMLERGAKHITLMARRQPSADEKNSINKMNLTGASVQVAIGDVSIEADVKSIIDRIQQSANPLVGIVHTAGVLDDKSVQNQTTESFARVMSPKVRGAWHLHKACHAIELEFFVMLSSAASLFGSPGQANYAAANSFLDGLANYRHSKGLPALALQLGMVDEIGMAAQPEREKSLNNQEIRRITPAEYLEALELNLSSQYPQIGLVPIDWDKWQLYATQWMFLEDFSDADAQSASQANSSVMLDPELVADIKADKAGKAQKLMVKYLQQLIGTVSETAPNMVETTVSLTSLGLDSLLVVELQKQLKTDFELTVPIALMFKSESLEQLSGELIRQLHDISEGKSAEDEEFYEEGML
ncbi:Acyl transferase domain-containing protein [Rheinheimera pacifica]|uniref:Acyl transferase domain-containing protein n=1 Tax=Rheinheimera pacifica TaxID=173990 RepID=A0A1H6N5F4_9GAMM|nr:type I polyketide synthase [Rheinheimera pacifica]SEI05611.1 Acyl transferase domain-containing protein [Rheinheimera pacifica]